jgi:hypothetical protein
MKITDITQNDWSNYVGLLTENQKQTLSSQQFTLDSYFNPIQDTNDNWVISIQEMQACTAQEFLWVLNLDVIEFSPKPALIKNP